MSTGAERVARDLHDEVIQWLFAAGLLVRGGLEQVGDEDVRARLIRCAELLDLSVEALRTAIVDLQSLGEGGSLRRRLLDVAAEFGALAPAIRMSGPLDSVVPEELHGKAETALRAALAVFGGRPEVSVEVSGGELLLDVTGRPSRPVDGWERTPAGLRWRTRYRS